MSLTLTDSGRISLTRMIKEQPLTLALGNGDPAWDALWGGATPPTVDGSESVLDNAFGALRSLSQDYVTPDENGSISISDGTDVQKYEISPTPTRLLYVTWRLDFLDAEGETIREVAIYFDAEFDASIPSGQDYIEDTGGNIASLGNLYALERMPPIIRTPEQKTFGRLMAL